MYIKAFIHSIQALKDLGLISVVCQKTCQKLHKVALHLLYSIVAHRRMLEHDTGSTHTSIKNWKGPYTYTSYSGKKRKYSPD